MTYTKLNACRVCEERFSHVVPLLYHFDQVNGREHSMLAIQRNSKIVHEYISLYIIII